MHRHTWCEVYTEVNPNTTALLCSSDCLCPCEFLYFLHAVISQVPEPLHAVLTSVHCLRKTKQVHQTWMGKGWCSLLAPKSRLSKGNVPITVFILLKLMNITLKLFWHETLHNLKLLLKMIHPNISFFLKSRETKLNGKRTYFIFKTSLQHQNGGQKF